MDDIWSIIGLSSLVASVVTVFLGIVRDVLVEKYRFKRQSEAGYLQSQVRLYSHIHFLLRSVRAAGLKFSREMFGKFSENVRELNDIIRKSSDLLDNRILDLWLAFMSLFVEGMEAMEAKEKVTEYVLQAVERRKQLLLAIKDIMNNRLIPEYCKIVGKTVPMLD